MRVRRVAMLACLVLSGCGGAGGGVVLWGPDAGGLSEAGGSPNLVLGPSREHVWLATEMNYRSSWPSVEAGYRLGDTSETLAIEYDDQFYYNRFGSYYRTSETVRRAVMLR